MFAFSFVSLFKVFFSNNLSNNVFLYSNVVVYMTTSDSNVLTPLQVGFLGRPMTVEGDRVEGVEGDGVEGVRVRANKLCFCSLTALINED